MEIGMDDSGDRNRRLRERFDELSGRISEAFADVHADRGVAEIDAVVAWVRRQIHSESDGARVDADSTD